MPVSTVLGRFVIPVYTSWASGSSIPSPASAVTTKKPPRTRTGLGAVACRPGPTPSKSPELIPRVEFQPTPGRRADARYLAVRFPLGDPAQAHTETGSSRMYDPSSVEV